VADDSFEHKRKLFGKLDAKKELLVKAEEVIET
jgi:hypothetical protein